MQENQEQNYLSLFEAAKLCSYSEPYLRLRARQGKLKSIKIGKKWMTTQDWISEYVKRAQEWNEKIAARRDREANIVLTSNMADKQPAGGEIIPSTYALPQIDFAQASNECALSIPQPPRTINYANPQFMFVLGSGALVALLLFVWMNVDLKISNGKDFSISQANVSNASQSENGGVIAGANSFEARMDPVVLEKEFAKNKNLTVIKKSEFRESAANNNGWAASVQRGFIKLLEAAGIK